MSFAESIPTLGRACPDSLAEALPTWGRVCLPFDVRAVSANTVVVTFLPDTVEVSDISDMLVANALPTGEVVATDVSRDVEAASLDTNEKVTPLDESVQVTDISAPMLVVTALAAGKVVVTDISDGAEVSTLPTGEIVITDTSGTVMVSIGTDGQVVVTLLPEC